MTAEFSTKFVHSIKNSISELNLNITNISFNKFWYSGSSGVGGVVGVKGGPGKLLEGTIVRTGVLPEVKVIVGDTILSNSNFFAL